MAALFPTWMTVVDNAYELSVTQEFVATQSRSAVLWAHSARILAVPVSSREAHLADSNDNIDALGNMHEDGHTVVPRWVYVAGMFILSKAHVSKSNAWRLSPRVQTELRSWFMNARADNALGAELWGLLSLCGTVKWGEPVRSAVEADFTWWNGQLSAKVQAVQVFRQLFFANYAGLDLYWRV